MEMGRLFAFNDAVFRSCNDRYGHLQPSVLFLESVSRRDHAGKSGAPETTPLEPEKQGGIGGP